MAFRVLNICFSIICVPGTCRTSWSWQPSKLTAHVSWSTSTASTTTTPQTLLTLPLAMSSSRRLLRSSGSSMWTHQQCRYSLSLKCHLWPEIYSTQVHKRNCSSCFWTCFLFFFYSLKSFVVLLDCRFLSSTLGIWTGPMSLLSAVMSRPCGVSWLKHSCKRGWWKRPLTLTSKLTIPQPTWKWDKLQPKVVRTNKKCLIRD